MIAVPKLERAFRTVSFATFAASFGFGAALVAAFALRRTPWADPVAYALIAPFLAPFVGAHALFFATAAAMKRHGERERIRSLARPLCWAFAGHVSFILQAIVAWTPGTVWEVAATRGPIGTQKTVVF